MSLRCAVVGVGHLGRFHAQKYKMIPEAELIGVCDANADQAQKIAGELQVKAYTSARDLIGKVDAVTIAASTPSHFSLCEMFLSNGVHVLVEKPITETSLEGSKLCELADRKKTRLQVGHVERFNPALQAVQGKLKDPLFIECHRLAPFKIRSREVDVVLDLMIHDLDVILSLVKSAPARVSAVGTPVLTKKLDIANARIEFESGAVANVTASRVSQKTERKFRVFQRDQYLSIDFQAGQVNLLTKTGDFTDDMIANDQYNGEIPLEHETHSMEKGDALLDETRDFVLSIVENRPVKVSGWDGLKALKLAEEIIKDAHRRLG